MEAFHYTCYLPLNGRLFELDGLKPYPIDHGALNEGEQWHDMARRVIQDRITFATGGEQSHDIRYNLMAVVPSQIDYYEGKLKDLFASHNMLIECSMHLIDNENIQVPEESKHLLQESKAKVDGLLERAKTKYLALNSDTSLNDSKENMDTSWDMHNTSFSICDIHSPTDIIDKLKHNHLDESFKRKLSLTELENDLTQIIKLVQDIESSIHKNFLSLKDEYDKRKKYKVDDARRTHNYDPFIRLFLAMLNEQGLLTNLIENNMIIRKRQQGTANRIQKNRKKGDKRKKKIVK